MNSDRLWTIVTATVLTAVSFWSFPGHTILQSDTQVYIPILQHLSDPSVLAWHREAVPALQAAGLLRMHALLHAGEFIAVLFCLADPPQAADRCCYDYLGGFDPRLRALSPGTLLVAYAIDHAVSERATAFDFLRGAEAYKYRWGAVDRPTQVLRLCPERAVAGSDASMNARTGAP